MQSILPHHAALHPEKKEEIETQIHSVLMSRLFDLRHYSKDPVPEVIY